jgi:hypothetical protein
MTINKNILRLLLLLLPFSACQESAPPVAIQQAINEEAILSAPQGRTPDEANTIDSLHIRELFAKLPTEMLNSAGLRTIDKKLRQQLLASGKAVPFLLQQKGFSLELREAFQQEDDADEARDIAHFVFFGNKSLKTATALLYEYSVNRKDKIVQQIKSVRFWQFDGKTWRDATTEQPWPELVMYYEEGQVLAQKPSAEFIPVFDPSQPNELKLELFNSKNPPVFSVKLRWIGTAFVLEQQDLNAISGL